MECYARLAAALENRTTGQLYGQHYLFSGHPGHLVDIVRMATALKGKVVTMFLPEGDISQYDLYGINSFNPVVYDAWNAVDVLLSMEEDKIDYYEALTSSLVNLTNRLG